MVFCPSYHWYSSATPKCVNWPFEVPADSTGDLSWDPCKHIGKRSNHMSYGRVLDGSLPMVSIAELCFDNLCEVSNGGTIGYENTLAVIPTAAGARERHLGKRVVSKNV